MPNVNGRYVPEWHAAAGAVKEEVVEAPEEKAPVKKKTTAKRVVKSKAAETASVKVEAETADQ